ncbi:MAG: hypothetical protein K0S92_679 [Desertimonas sp.]|jgi:hypothetical protein|nr:hypothetical protein [Desertimonas sp.]
MSEPSQLKMSEGPVTDDDFAAMTATERDFALRWTRMTADEQEWFRKNLLAAIEVLRRLGVLDPPHAGEVRST